MSRPTSKEFKHFDHALNKITGWRAPSSVNATANLLKEERLSQKANRLHQIGVATEQAEEKLPKTASSLSSLGAGKEYGS